MTASSTFRQLFENALTLTAASGSLQDSVTSPTLGCNILLSVTVTVELCSDDTLLAAVLLIFSNCFKFPNTTTDKSKRIGFFFCQNLWKSFKSL